MGAVCTIKFRNKNVGVNVNKKCHNKNVGSIFIMKCHNNYEMP